MKKATQHTALLAIWFVLLCLQSYGQTPMIINWQHSGRESFEIESIYSDLDTLVSSQLRELTFLTPKDTIYQYRVRAFKDGKFSLWAYSNIINEEVTKPDTISLDAPTSVGIIKPIIKFKMQLITGVNDTFFARIYESIGFLKMRLISNYIWDSVTIPTIQDLGKHYDDDIGLSEIDVYNYADSFSGDLDGEGPLDIQVYLKFGNDYLPCKVEINQGVYYFSY